MGNKTLNLRTMFKKHCALLLAGIILISSLSGVLILGNTINADAASVFDAQNTSSYTELVTENFKDSSYDNDKWVNPYNAAQFSEKGLKVNNPTPGFTAGGTNPSYLSNILWLNKTFETTDQHIAAEIYFEQNPTLWSDNQYAYLWGRTVMGDKFGGTNRADHNKATGGYCLRISSGDTLSIDVLRRLNNDEKGLMKLGFNGATIIDNRPGTYRFELNITGNNPVIINARILEKSGDNWNVVANGTCYDDSTSQIASGTAGVGMYTNGCANAYFENFRYITTDVPNGSNESYNYVEKTAVDSTGRLFAQVVTLNPKKKYQLTAYTNTMDNSIMERFWVEYLSVSGAKQSGNKHRVEIEQPTISQIDGKYVAASKVFCINTHVTRNRAAKANTTASNWLQGDTENRTNAIIGFRLDSGKTPQGNFSRTGTFTHFELYEIDDNGNRVGGNLILNPDFKLGLYGWNDNQETTYTNYTTGEVGDSVSDKNLVTCYTCADKREFESMFTSGSAEINNTYYKLKKDKELNITYMGGSVVSGHGASDPETTSWRGLLTTWFKTKYPNATINAKNAAVGSTGSHFALYNFDRINEDTDLLVLGASPNDFYLYNNQINGNVNPEASLTYEYAYRHVESLLVKAYEKNPNMDIVIVLLIDHWRINDITYLKAYTDLAKKYNIPLLDTRIPLKEQADKDGFAWSSDGLLPYRTAGHEKQLFLGNGDGVHPNDAGYKLYGDYISGIFEGLLDLTETPDKLIDRTPNSTMVGNIIKDTKVITADEIPLADGWTHSSTPFSSISSKFGETYTAAKGIVSSSTVGATLSFTFTGTDFGFITRTGSQYGKVYVEIDGVAYRKGDNGAFDDGVLDFYRGNTDHRTQIIMWNNSNTKHTVTIKVLEGKIEIGAYYMSGTPDSQGSGSGGGSGDSGDGGDGEGDGEQGGSGNITAEDWLLSSAASISGNVLKITGSIENDSYLKNYAFNKSSNVNQMILVETDVNKNDYTSNFDPVLWLRANYDEADIPATITGYYAKFSINQRVEIFRRYKDGDVYKTESIGTINNNNDTRKFRYEFVCESVGEQTKLTATVSKYGSDGTTLYMMSRNTFYDDNASLQDAGYAGVSIKIRAEQPELTCSFTNVEYNTVDNAVDEYFYLSKSAEEKTNTNFGQMLALDPEKTYVVSALVTEKNKGFFVEYNSGSSSAAYTRMIMNSGKVDSSDGFRRMTAEFNIKEFITENETADAYVDGGYKNAQGTKLVLVMIGFRLNNTDDMAYSEFTVYEKDDALKRNLFTNADYKMGLYGYSDGMNGTFMSLNLGTFGSVKSFKERVTLEKCDEAKYNSLFKVSADEEDSNDFDFDYENYDGEYMLYCYEDSSYDYGKFGQLVELEKGKTYIYTLKYKHILQKQVSPIALYYTDEAMVAASRKTLKWDEEKDEENSIITYTIEVPSDAFLVDNKTKMLVGLTLGEKGGINYFCDFLLYDEADQSKTNLFKNPDFKQGFYGWIHTTGYTTIEEKQKRVYRDDDLALVLLPYDSSVFINDTNDKSWNDGDWAAVFGPDDEVKTESGNNSEGDYSVDNDSNNDSDKLTDEDKTESKDDIIEFDDYDDEISDEDKESTSKKQVQQILATRKYLIRGKVNVPATIALIGGIVLGVTAAAGAVWFIIAKKRKK